MCDYSLMHFPNRLAAEGEQLIVHRFSSGSLGLASPADLAPKICEKSGEPRSFWTSLKKFFNPVENGPVPAVCIPPGARLKLQDVAPSMRRQYEVNSEEEVVFQQLTAVANSYRDAIVFHNGVTLTLQELPKGQRMIVVSLASQEIELPVMDSPVRIRNVS